MERIRTIVVNDAEAIFDDVNTVKLTNDYIELIPKNKFIRYLKMNIYFKNFNKRDAPIPATPVVIINGQKCPIMIQTDFEISATADMVIESVMINNDFAIGHLMFIECDNYLVK